MSRSFPHAIALVDDATSVTYGELAVRADVLAAALRGLGVGRGAIVAVCLPRSAAQIVAALGTMRAGAAYLPLDPGQPAERTAYTLRDAGVSATLTAAQSGVAIPVTAWALALSADGRLVGDVPRSSDSEAVPSDAEPGDLAYLIYTSGSTGQPKGVEITHAGLMNLIGWHQRAFAIEPADRAGHLSAVGFDAAIWEVWPYLCAGASVWIAADPIARDPTALRDWLVANAITIAFASTPIAQRLIDLPYPPETALRILLTGADTLHRFPPATLPFALYNNYGPTEATVVATSARIDAADDDGGLPSIGWPIDGVSIAIIDAQGNALPDGSDGEICIAGVGLARGYHGQPELTAQAFRWRTVAAEAPVRWYHTGDRGRREADGRIAYLGRLDDQVKLRGFRVEPREIESALNAHASIAESAVVVRVYGPGDERLVAYIVAHRGTPVDLDDLLAFLSRRLPAYMVPATFFALPALPLTTNGKIDRAGLGSPVADVALGARAYVAPRTSTEQRLATVVAPLLKVERVSADDDFFKLGGHSLLGTQLIARVRDTFGVKIGLRFLFESPTIAGLALEIERLMLAKLQPASESDAPTALASSAGPIRKRAT